MKTKTASPTIALKIIAAIFTLQIADIAAGSSPMPDNEVESCKAVLLGASYAKGWPVARIGAFSVVNKGIGGNQSFEMAERFQADVATQDPDAVILWGFINDFFRAPQGPTEETKQRVLDSYSQMISDSVENGIRPIIATEVSVREPAGFSNWVAGIVGRLRGKTSYQTMINGYVSETNQDLVELAAAHSVEVLDFYRVLSDEDGRRRSEFATEDGSHITTAAYDELTKYVSENFSVTCRAGD